MKFGIVASAFPAGDADRPGEADRSGAFDCSGIADTTGSFVGMIDGDVEGLGLGVAAGAHWQPTAARSRAVLKAIARIFLFRLVLI